MGLNTWHESEAALIADARMGSARLLERIKANHDFDIQPPKGWRPRKTPASPAFVLPPKKIKKFWFEPLADEAIRAPRVSDIKIAACDYFGITIAEIDSARRTLKVVYPRQIAAYLSRILTTKSYPEIGRRFGDRDHTTILHACNKIQLHSRLDWKVAYDVAMVEARI